MRNSSVCMIRMPNEICFGSIRRFCYIGEAQVAIASLFDRTNEDILKEPRPTSILHTEDHIAARCINSFIFKVKKISLTQKMVAFSVDRLIKKCVHIPIKHSSTDYIVTIPNIIEHH